MVGTPLKAGQPGAAACLSAYFEGTGHGDGGSVSVQQFEGQHMTSGLVHSCLSMSRCFPGKPPGPLLSASGLLRCLGGRNDSDLLRMHPLYG